MTTRRSCSGFATSYTAFADVLEQLARDQRLRVERHIAHGPPRAVEMRGEGQAVDAAGRAGQDRRGPPHAQTDAQRPEGRAHAIAAGRAGRADSPPAAAPIVSLLPAARAASSIVSRPPWQPALAAAGLVVRSRMVSCVRHVPSLRALVDDFERRLHHQRLAAHVFDRRRIEHDVAADRIALEQAEQRFLRSAASAAPAAPRPPARPVPRTAAPSWPPGRPMIS